MSVARKGDVSHGVRKDAVGICGVKLSSSFRPRPAIDSMKIDIAFNWARMSRTGAAESRARAKLRGQHVGRPPEMTTAQTQEARRRRKDGDSVGDLAPSYGVSPAAIYRTTAAA